MNFMMGLYIAGGIVLVLLIVAFVLSLPDILRYIRINRM
jgi:hypothetical protein